MLTTIEGGSFTVQTIARDPETGVMIGGIDARVEGNGLGFQRALFTNVCLL